MKKTKDKKDIDYYLSLPWTYTIETEISGSTTYCIIKVNELPSICTDSESLDEGMGDIKKLIACAVEIYKEKGEPVPLPISKEQYKGKIMYRTDSKRHFLIAKAAKSMHRSISKTIDTLVDTALQQLAVI